MDVNDNAGYLNTPHCPRVFREQARSHKDLRGTGRSEPAREKRADNAGIQTARVIVDVHRDGATVRRFDRPAPTAIGLSASNHWRHGAQQRHRRHRANAQ